MVRTGSYTKEKENVSIHRVNQAPVKNNHSSLSQSGSKPRAYRAAESRRSKNYDEEAGAAKGHQLHAAAKPSGSITRELAKYIPG